MLKRKIATLSVVILANLPLISFAGIVINNDTDSYGTGRIGSKCSGDIGSGILAPHSKLEIPAIALILYCGSKCNAELYTTKDCSGDAIASLRIVNKEIASAVNNQPDKFDITWTNSNITINDKSNGIMNWLKRLFR